jgi:O-antigen biosynthesis protein WbqP
MIMYPIVKRVADIQLAILLVLFLAPLYAIIASLIWAQDRGTPLFKQVRVGRDGTPFVFFKFRSMPLATPEVESRDTQKLTVTPIGRFLRRSNLDELPQFINVLKGDMSFIGPRPPIQSQGELIEMRRQNGSLSLRPGLTGWAQVNAYDGMPQEVKARYDGEYYSQLSFKMDVLILLKTIGYFTRKPPTY